LTVQITASVSIENHRETHASRGKVFMNCKHIIGYAEVEGAKKSTVRFSSITRPSARFRGRGISQWLDDRGVRVPAGAGNFSLHHRVQTDSGIHLVSYPMGTRV